MTHYIKKLIAEGEHQRLDFKFEISDARKMARTLSAFSNTGGGRLLVGVKDNGVITGVRTDEERYMVEAAAHIYCKPRVDYKMEDWNIDGKWVLEVVIPEANPKPCYAKGEDGRWLAYIRVNDENILANGILMDVWRLKKRSEGVYIRYGLSENKILKLLSSNSPLTIDEIAGQSCIKKYLVGRILARLVSADVALIGYDEHRQVFSLNATQELIL